jgi:hypothetical protein
LNNHIQDDIENAPFDKREGISKIMYAVKTIEDSLEGKLPNGMYKMKAVG